MASSLLCVFFQFARPICLWQSCSYSMAPCPSARTRCELFTVPLLKWTSGRGLQDKLFYRCGVAVKYWDIPWQCQDGFTALARCDPSVKARIISIHNLLAPWDLKDAKCAERCWERWFILRNAGRSHKQTMICNLKWYCHAFTLHHVWRFFNGPKFHDAGRVQDIDIGQWIRARCSVSWWQTKRQRWSEPETHRWHRSELRLVSEVLMFWSTAHRNLCT